MKDATDILDQRKLWTKKGQTMNEIVLGFQLREGLERYCPWDPLRRSTFLLREDIKFPISVDSAIWPACDNEGLLSKLFADYEVGENVAPNGLDVYNIAGPSVLDQPSNYPHAFLIAIAVVNDRTNVANVLKSKHCILDIQYTIGQLKIAGWARLGYDVADYWLYSGLMNCGFALEEKASLFNRFGPAINEFGLFDSGDAAHEFRVNCDLRVPEHSPFGVYGIWSKGKPVQVR